MDIGVEGKWEGMDETKKMLDSLGTKFARSATRKALRAGAKIVQRALIAAAPVDSGTTKAAIKVRAGKRSRSKISVLCLISSLLFKRPFYAGFANYGHIWSRRIRLKTYAYTRTKERRGKKTVPIAGPGEKYIPGSHWLEQARDSSLQAVDEGVKTTLLEEINEYIKGQDTEDSD